MAALRYSFLYVLFMSSCVTPAETKEIIIDNDIEGCFTLKFLKLDFMHEPVVLHASVFPEKSNLECPCKSALVKYSSIQKKGTDYYTLLEGNFTALGKNIVILPIAVQKQLILPNIPINILLSCSDH